MQKLKASGAGGELMSEEEYITIDENVSKIRLMSFQEIASIVQNEKSNVSRSHRRIIK
jgi:hypothetical protein